MDHIKEINRDLLDKLFESNVLPRVRVNRSEQYSNQYSEEEWLAINSIIGVKSTVVGIDIYRYSQFSPEKQMFVPHLFDLIYEHSWQLITQNFSFLFQHYDAVDRPREHKLYIKPKEYFISTGDGGYQILETPIHAVIYILIFATILRLYNSDYFMRKLHAKIGNIEVRYTITQDDIYKYRNNFYGASIINNARILSKDRLNRLLIDRNTYDWFLNRTLGIENLMSLDLLEIMKIEEFSKYEDNTTRGNNALITIDPTAMQKEGIKAIDVQKIGKIKSKESDLDIYNLHMQAVIHFFAFFQEKEKIITVSVGNLNTSGIEGDKY